MKALLMDIGSTFVKYAVFDGAFDKYVLSERLPFPTPCGEEPFIVDRCKIDTVVKAVMEAAKDNERISFVR